MAEASGAGVSYRVLARKYRPQDFTTLIGQEAMVRTLRNAIDAGRVAHAFMLTGVRGIGKTTTARIIARALNCIGPDGKGGTIVDPCGVCEHCVAITEDRHVDVIEMDAASRTGVDNIRELIDGVRYRPTSARYKVYIIDEIHMLSDKAFNALLKTLEEPPPHVKFVFATTELRKVPVTVLSRCQRFDLRRVPPDVLQKHFASIAGDEKVEISPDALALITRAADGSVRDGLSLLDQAIVHGGGVVDAAQVREMLGLADRGRIFDLLELVMHGKAPEALVVLTQLYDAGADPLVILQDLLDLVHWLTRLRTTPQSAANAPELERVRGVAMADKLAISALTRAWQMLLKGLDEVMTAPSPIDAAEMLVIRLCYAAELPAPAELVQGLLGAGAATPAAPRSNGGARPLAGAGRLVSDTQAAVATPPPSGGGNVVAALRPQPEAPPDEQALPAPADFGEVVALFVTRREAHLAHHLVHHVHEVGCEPGRLELRPTDKAPPDLASRLASLLSQWTGRRWVVTLSNAAGAATLADQRAARDDASRARALEHPMVKAVMAAFPGAQLEAVRMHGDAVATPATHHEALASTGESTLPALDEYAFDEIPEGDT